MSLIAKIFLKLKPAPVNHLIIYTVLMGIPFFFFQTNIIAETVKKQIDTYVINNQAISFTSSKIIFLADGSYYKALIKKIAKSKKTIQIGMYLFKITANPNNKANKLVNALGRAAKRGVTISVLLEKSNYNYKLNRSNSYTRKILEKKKIKVRFESPTVQSHLKLIIIDERWIFVGSHNLSHTALSKNNELSVLIDSPKFAREAAGYLNKIQ